MSDPKNNTNSRHDNISHLNEALNDLRALISRYETVGESDFYKIQSKINIIIEGVMREETRYYNPHDVTIENYKKISDAINFDIEIKDRVTTLTIPGYVMPPRKSLHHHLWKNILFPCFQSNQDKFIRYLTRVQVTIITIYEEGDVMLDYDNVYYKILIDYIKDFMLVGDNPECLRLVYDAEIGEKRGTRVEIREIEPMLNQIS